MAAEKVTAAELRDEMKALREKIESLEKKGSGGGLTDADRTELKSMRSDINSLRKVIEELPVVSADEAAAAFGPREPATVACPSCGFPDLRGTEQQCPNCKTSLEWEA